jgi:uncharacterized Fe-S cluster-containing protein
MNKLVDEAPYHPGYEDAVVTPAPKYTGMNPAKMIWKSKPLTNDEIVDLRLENEGIIEFARAIEERHGIK